MRNRRAPSRFTEKEYVLLANEGEPRSFEEVKKDAHNKEWLHAMQDEIESLHDKHTYELTELQKGKKAP